MDSAIAHPEECVPVCRRATNVSMRSVLLVGVGKRLLAWNSPVFKRLTDPCDQSVSQWVLVVVCSWILPANDDLYITLLSFIHVCLSVCLSVCGCVLRDEVILHCKRTHEHKTLYLFVKRSSLSNTLDTCSLMNRWFINMRSSITLIWHVYIGMYLCVCVCVRAQSKREREDGVWREISMYDNMFGCQTLNISKKITRIC